MCRILWVVALAGVLGGCAQMPQWSWAKGFANLDVAQHEQAFSFDWQLSGDPHVAPLQVFDDGSRTWLQFPSEQVPPALFRRSERGDVLLRAARDGAYLIVDGVWPHLLVRGGHLVAHVRRVAPQVPVDMPVVVPPDTPAEVLADVPPPAPLGAPREEPAVPLALSDLVIGPRVKAVPEPPLIASAAHLTAASLPEFRVSPADGNLRLALVRWARMAGWTFGPDHWAVEVDIPLTGTAVFGTVFKPAVRDLLAATELGDRPLQPCFYANQVLRIVPFAQRCDRTLAPGAV